MYEIPSNSTKGAAVIKPSICKGGKVIKNVSSISGYFNKACPYCLIFIEVVEILDVIPF